VERYSRCNLFLPESDIGVIRGRADRKASVSDSVSPARHVDGSPVMLCGMMITSALTMEDETKGMEDAEIVSQVLSGNMEAFRYLMARYESVVMSIVKRHVPWSDVEDNMQEVFLRSYRSLPAFKGDSGLRPWLSMIAVRTCYDFWRTHYKRQEVQVGSLSDRQEEWLEAALAGASSWLFHEEARRKEAREVLEWAMESLSAGDRMALELVYFEDRSVKEAAELLGWSTVNVKVRLFRARKKLHALLAGRLHAKGATHEYV
jgi:RNA polymerase sigma-70 factor, ECF subfamily